LAGILGIAVTNKGSAWERGRECSTQFYQNVEHATLPSTCNSEKWLLSDGIPVQQLTAKPI